MRILWGFDLPSQNNFVMTVEKENYSQHYTEKDFFFRIPIAGIIPVISCTQANPIIFAISC